MATPDGRIAELIAAAAAGELDDAETAELDRLRRDQPWIDDEIRSLAAVAGRLRHGDVTWTSPRDTDALRERTLAALRDEGAAQAPAAAASAAPVRRRWLLPAVAAACLVAGAGIGLAVPTPAPAPVTGAPGTLGALEALAVTDDLAGVDVDADLVAHTWGTETLLEATGLTVGATYSVVLVSDDGAEYTAGQVLGSEVPIVCRMNAAVMRDDAVRLEIRDTGATVIAHADLPTV